MDDATWLAIFDSAARLGQYDDLNELVEPSINHAPNPIVEAGSLVPVETPDGVSMWAPVRCERWPSSWPVHDPVLGLLLTEVGVVERGPYNNVVRVCPDGKYLIIMMGP